MIARPHGISGWLIVMRIIQGMAQCVTVSVAPRTRIIFKNAIVHQHFSSYFSREFNLQFAPLVLQQADLSLHDELGCTQCLPGYAVLWKYFW